MRKSYKKKMVFYHLQNVSGCFRLESKWNTNVKVAPAENFEEATEDLKGYSCFSERNVPNENSCSISSKPCFSPVSGLPFDLNKFRTKLAGSNLLTIFPC